MHVAFVGVDCSGSDMRRKQVRLKSEISSYFSLFRQQLFLPPPPKHEYNKANDSSAFPWDFFVTQHAE